MATATRRRGKSAPGTAAKAAETATEVGEERVGLELRNARRNKSLSLVDVAQDLKIRKTYIEAIEKSRFSDLPGPTYAVGFVRSYAQLLQLDHAAVVERFRSEIAGLEKKTELQFLLPPQERRFPGAALIGASLALGAMVYGGWYFISDNAAGSGSPKIATSPASKAAKTAKSAKGTKKKAIDAAVKSRPAAGGKNVVAPAGKTQSGTQSGTESGTETGPRKDPRAQEGKPGRATELVKPAVVAAAPVVISEAAMRASADRDLRERLRLARERKEAARLARLKAIEAARAEKLAAGRAPLSGKARIVLRAVQNTWVKLQYADGTLAFSRILKAGEHFPIVMNRVMMLTAGNAGGLRIVVDGRTLPALGPTGAVRQGIRLDADALLASR